MSVIGMEEVVEAPGLFDSDAMGFFLKAVSRGARNVYENVTTFAIAGVVVTAVGAVAPATIRTDAPFREPAPVVSHEERRWAASINGLESLIANMHAGARPEFADELSSLSLEALTSSRARTSTDVDAWAMALASEVADLDD